MTLKSLVPNFRSDIVVKYVDHMGDDHTPLQAARVSTLGSKSLGHSDDDRDNGLRNFLLREQHLVPFEHQYLTVYIEAPIFVTRQILKHRISSISEESGRYREMSGDFYLPHPDRKWGQVGKTGDYNMVDLPPGSDKEVLKSAISQSCAYSWSTYQLLLAQGVAKEVARIVLPVNLYSSMYLTMNSRSLFNLFDLRTSMGISKPQFEIEMVAKEILSNWQQRFPLTYKAWEAGYNDKA